MKKNIAVIFGGVSSEHDISIITAHQVMNNLNKNEYNILPIYINKAGKWFSGESLFDIGVFTEFNEKQKGIFKVHILPSSNLLYKEKNNKLKKLCRLDCAVISMHGVNGEDGSIQGLLELSDIAYTSSGVLGSSLCMDKVLSKRVFESFNLPVLPWFYILRKEVKAITKIDRQITGSFNYPVIIKPANLGSSIGISVCNSKTQLKEGLQVASEFDSKIIIEKAVKNLKEINCAVLGTRENAKISSLEEPVSYTKFLTFEEKYLKENSKNSKGGMENLSRILPAKITKKQRAEIKKLSLKAFKELECSGVVRIDFIIDKDIDKIYINEINTIPGSFAFYLWEHIGLTFCKLLDELIELAIEKQECKKQNKYSFNSGVLLNFSGGSKGIKN